MTATEGNAQIRKLHGAANVETLIDLLTDPSWVVRRAVVDNLASLGKPAVTALREVIVEHRENETRLAAAVDALVASRDAVDLWIGELADHPNPDVVADVAQILGRRKNPASVPILVKLTEHANDNVAVAAIEGLGKIGGRAAVEALIRTIAGGNFFRTFPAIDVLGRSGDPRAVEPLALLLNNSGYQPEAARALGRTGAKSAVDFLVALVDSSSDGVVRVAAMALADLRERFEEKSGEDGSAIDERIRETVTPVRLRRLGHVLANSDTPEAVAISKVLGATGSAEAAPFLSAALHGSVAIAASAGETLKKIGKQSDGVLLEAIREGDSARRRVLLPLVSHSSEAVHVACSLRDLDADVRALACDTLARLGNPAVIRDLFPLLADTNPRVVHSATGAIQALGSREARVLAAEAANSPNSVVRRAALRILSYFGDAAALTPMLRGLGDSDRRVREAAIQGLPYLEDQTAAEALYQACRSADPRTRALATRSLAQVPKASERTYSLLLKGLSDSDSWVRYYACQSLGRLAYLPVVPDLARLLDDPAGQVRVSAVEALSHLDIPEAHEALRVAAESQDVDVRRAAIVGLGIGCRGEDLPVVLSAADTPDTPTRLIALSAIANFASPRALQALSAAASDPDLQIRTAAIGFLAARPEQQATGVLVELLGRKDSDYRAKEALLVPSAGRIAGIVVALDSANDDLAPVLVSILARVEKVEGKAVLLSLMKSTNVAARKAVACALAARRDPEVVAVLQEAAEHDPTQEVREICSLLTRQ